MTDEIMAAAGSRSSLFFSALSPTRHLQEVPDASSVLRARPRLHEHVQGVHACGLGGLCESVQWLVGPDVAGAIECSVFPFSQRQVRMCNPREYTPSNPVITCGAGPTPCQKPTEAPATYEAPTTRRDNYDAPTTRRDNYDAPETRRPSSYTRRPRTQEDRYRVQKEWDQRRTRRAAQYQSGAAPAPRARRQPRSVADRQRIQTKWDKRRASRGYGRGAGPQPQVIDVGDPRYRA